MSESNCPNCGAPKRGSVCAYCGTHFVRHEGQFVIEVKPREIAVYEWDGTARYIRLGTDVNVRMVE